MTRLQAMKELACRIEAGEWFPGLAQLSFGGVQNYHNALSAYHGSLDAAQALNEALLPGWSPVIDICVPGVDMYCEIKDDASISTGEWEWMLQVSTDANPARSWLLAILKALITEEEWNE